MSCNIERFRNEEQVIKETWGKPIIEGDPDVSIYFYRGGCNMNVVNDKTHEILLSCGDGLDNTFEKTIKAFLGINRKDYDYVIRTNTTTYLNIPLLKQVIEQLDNTAQFYGGRLVSNRKSEYVPFFRGCFMMFPKSLVTELLEVVPKYGVKGVDDIDIAKILCNERRKDGNLKEYIELLREAPGIEKISETDFLEKVKTAYYIRAKENKTGENHVAIFKVLHELLSGLNCEYEVTMPHKVTKVETIKGIINLNI